MQSRAYSEEGELPADFNEDISTEDAVFLYVDLQIRVEQLQKCIEITRKSHYVDEIF